MAIKTIVFDFGNVIGLFSHRRAVAPLLPYTNLTEQQIIERVVDGKLEDDFERGAITSASFVHMVRERCLLQCPDELIARSLADMFWLNEPVDKLIPRLRPRYRLLLGSNTNELHYRHFRSTFSATLANFDHLIVSHEIGARKPTRAFFEHCQLHALCAPQECVFVDDLPANIAGAQALGWKGIVYRDFAELVRELENFGISFNPEPAATALDSPSPLAPG